MRLIDADELKKKIMTKDDANCETWEELYDDVLNSIDNAPTADDWQKYSDELWKNAYERGKQDARTTGEWRRDKVAFYLECSECGCDIRDANTCFLTDEDALNFCPNCGADMRGGKE